MSLTIFWTDALLWILLAFILIATYQVKKDVQKRLQWRQIFASKVAMSAGIVLAFYFLIALTDSVHLKLNSAQTQSSQTTLSVLDLGLQHLIQNQERTYSAPFAIQEYSTSIMYHKNGEVTQDYLPLKNVATHQQDGEFATYLIRQAFIAFAITLLLLLPIMLWHGYFRYKNKTLQQTSSIKLPWKTAYATLFILLLSSTWIVLLSFDYHVLGTNKVGQDVLYQSIKSIRTGVLIGGLTTLVMLPLALLLGISAGYFKGWVDDIIQYLYTTLNSIPGVLLIAAAVLVMQSIMSSNPQWFGSTEERADLRLLFLILILGMTSWTGLCRLLRAETLKISQIEYVTAARAFGVHPFKIISRHIYPNLVHLVLIAVVIDFSGLVLAEAVLSYVGIGVDPTMPSWGNMINQARLEMAREPMVWWSLLSAFCFMFILVLSANLFADRVQWVFNPRSEK